MRKTFNSVSFLTKYRIPYIDHGVNVKRGEVNIRCPYCLDDPSFHLGLDDQRLVFSCWRNPNHRGKLHKLVMHLAKVSFSTACEILGQNALWFSKSQFDSFMADPASFFDDGDKAKALDKVFPFIDDIAKMPESFERYLTDRGFFVKHIPQLFKDYSLKYCVEGLYRNRIIVPVSIRNDLMTFTSRTITKDGIRYLTLSEKDGALDSIKETVFNFDSAEGKVLFVCEGPFDALKLDFYGKSLGGRATCLFGKNIKPTQALLLDEMSERFDKIVLLLDSTEMVSSMIIQRQLSFIKRPIVVGELPTGVDDPGDLSMMQCKALVKKYV